MVEIALLHFRGLCVWVICAGVILTSFLPFRLNLRLVGRYHDIVSINVDGPFLLYHGIVSSPSSPSLHINVTSHAEMRWVNPTFRRAPSNDHVRGAASEGHGRRRRTGLPVTIICQIRGSISQHLNRFAVCHAIKLWLEREYRMDADVIMNGTHKTVKAQQTASLRHCVKELEGLELGVMEEERQEGKWTTKHLPKGRWDFHASQVLQRSDDHADIDAALNRLFVQSMLWNQNGTANDSDGSDSDDDKRSSTRVLLYVDRSRNSFVFVEKYHAEIRQYLACKWQCLRNGGVGRPLEDETVVGFDLWARQYSSPGFVNNDNSRGDENTGAAASFSKVEPLVESLVGHLPPRSKVVLITGPDSGVKNSTLVASLEIMRSNLGLQARHVALKSAVHQYCYLRSSGKEVIGSAFDDNFVLAGLLTDNRTRVVIHGSGGDPIGLAKASTSRGGYAWMNRGTTELPQRVVFLDTNAYDPSGNSSPRIRQPVAEEGSISSTTRQSSRRI